MNEKKISEIIIDIGGDLISCAKNKEEMQAHVNLVCGAWNMALHSKERRQIELSKFLRRQRPYAPDEESLKGLEWEFRRIMKEKDRKYPSIKNEIVAAVVVERSKDDYVIRAMFQ